MKRVLKFPVGLGEFRVIAPSTDRAKVLKVDKQDGMFFMWIECHHNPATSFGMTFAVFGTGHSIPEDAKHCGTWLDRQYVWHLYELKDEEEDK